MDTLKESVCNAFAAWIRQRPRLDYGNYGDATSYRTECRRIARDKRDAETLLAAVRWRDSITGQDIIEAARGAYSGRMTIDARRDVAPFSAWRVRIDYVTGQYWPTEYRRAAAAVLASCLWSYARDNMPAPDGYAAQSWGKWRGGRFAHDMLGKFATREAAEACLANAGGRDVGHVVELFRDLPPGDYLRRKFRAEFGSALQRRYFN